MAGEKLTPQPNVPDQAQEQAKQELLRKFPPLADGLLTDAVKHTQSWKRAIYSIPRERTQDFYDELMQSGLSELVTGHKNPETKEDYPTIAPDDAYIVAEEFDFSKHTQDQKNSKQAELEIGLRYRAQGGEFNDIRIRLTAGRTQVTSNVFSSEYSETGYEGHSWRTQELDKNQLQSFYELLVNNVTTRLPEKPLEEQLTEIKEIS